MDLKAADLMVAIVTPFTEANEINYPALDQLTEHLLANGANGFVIGGTTGETPTLSHDEKLPLYRHFGALVAGLAATILPKRLPLQTKWRPLMGLMPLW